MSMPLDQQPAPVTIIQQQSYNTHSAHGSIGPVIAVLVVILILGMLAAMIGRLCSGRTIMGYGQYDIESWAEAKCSSCIDGRIYPPPATAPTTRSNVSSTSISESMPVQTEPEVPKQEEQSPSTTSTNVDS